jgi:hypothetical protein
LLRILRAVAATVGAGDTQCRGLLIVAFRFGKRLRLTAWHHAQFSQGLLHNRQQPRQPPVRTPLAQPKNLAPQRWPRRGLQLHQAQQQLLLRRAQLPFASPAAQSLTGTPSCSSLPLVDDCRGDAKRLRQRDKLFVGQSGQRQQLPPVFFQSFIFKHQPILAYFA